MSREIKFRFFSEETDRYIDANDFCVTGNGEVYCITDLNGYREPYEISHVVNKEQYTGLKDKNGVEIYEGDIVKWGHVEGFIEMSGVRVAVVDMSNSCDGLTFDAFKPVVHRFKIGNFMYRQSTDKCMEVIGNIHQNPELLK